MIKTKSILDRPSVNDGTRICVMRYIKPFYIYNEWIIDLAPSKLLLSMYRNGDIDWEGFETLYNKEMDSKTKMTIIKSLRKRSDDGEIITLLCWEKNDSKCHRRLLKGLIER